MGDDYDILCKDLMNQIELLIEAEGKASARVKRLSKLLLDARERENNFKEYRGY